MAIDPILPTDATAQKLAIDLMSKAKFAALAVIHPDTNTPFVSRISFGLTADGLPLSLISGLAVHSKALRQNPACSLLIGEPPAKGDALAFPRLTLQAVANILPPEQSRDFRASYLATHPKAKLYIDLPDFRFVRFDVETAFLNAGFGKAYSLAANDLT